MSDRLDARKLEELHTKTDRQLAILIGNKLDRGLTMARALGTYETRSDWAAAEGYLAGAQGALAEVRTWLPLVGKPERLRLEFKVAQLRRLLDELTAPETRVRTACS
jgi:hypothetical protein